jgi:tripartite-type tricarboxylate transporter receptor subunit TctC
MHRRQWIAFTVAAAAAGSVFAQGYPTKVVKLVVPFAPGGTTDIVARVISEPLGKALGKSVIVENKAGGGGVIGANETVRPPRTATRWAWPRCPPRRPTRRSTPRSLQPADRLHAHHQHRGHAQRDRGASELPGQGLQGLHGRTEEEPGPLLVLASSGTGGIGHLQMELYKNLSGTFITHIPYRGAGPALNDTVAGQVPIIFDNLPSALPFIKDGRLIPIVVAAPSAWRCCRTCPTFKEVGLEPVNRMAYYGISAPRACPRRWSTRSALR